jgi:large subunit ribosomal protein L10
LAITRERKEEVLADYIKLLERSEGLIVTEYRGMKMTAFQDLRAALRDVGASYFVTKNRLLKIALRNQGLPAPDSLLTGPVAIGFAHRDIAGMAKVLIDKSKAQELLILKGAIVGQSVFGQDDLQTISELPSINELRAALLGLLVQPAQSLLGVLGAPAQQLVGVLDAGSNSLVNVLAAYEAQIDAA